MKKKELLARIEKLEAEVEALRARVIALEARPIWRPGPQPIKIEPGWPQYGPTTGDSPPLPAYTVTCEADPDGWKRYMAALTSPENRC